MACCGLMDELEIWEYGEMRVGGGRCEVCPSKRVFFLARAGLTEYIKRSQVTGHGSHISRDYSG